MYQWKETFNEARRGSRAYYTYAKTWSEEPIDSSKFTNSGFDNPSAIYWPFKSNVTDAEKVKLGKYILEPSQI